MRALYVSNVETPFGFAHDDEIAAFEDALNCLYRWQRPLWRLLLTQPENVRILKVRES